MIATENDGPLILSSTYWGSEYDQAGKPYCSVNAGCLRVLVPQSDRTLIDEARKCQFVTLSRGPWPAAGAAEAVEILFEDDSDSPYAVHLTSASFDSLPARPLQGQEWTITLWELLQGKPHRVALRRCLWRRVPQLPWLKP